jgi:hypothetical protein
LPPETGTDADVELAEHEAAEAEELVAMMETAVLHEAPEHRPTAAELAEARHLSEFARRRIAVTQQRAEEARAARKLAALSTLAGEIDAFAAEASGPPTALSEPAARLAKAAAAFRAACQDHDDRLNDLIGQAATLGSEPATFGRTAASSAHVAHTGHGGAVRHGDISVLPIASRVKHAVELAVAGDVDGALEHVVTVHTVTDRADHYFRDVANGQVLPCNGNWRRRPYADLVDSGRITKMSSEEVDAYLEGQ